MKLFTKQQFQQLIENGRRQAAVPSGSRNLDFTPVVKLFNPYGAGTWLITEIDPDDNDIAWCLADLGMQCAEFGTISLSELSALRHPIGFPLIERDRNWQPRAPISAYIKASSAAGCIVEPAAIPATA